MLRALTLCATVVCFACGGDDARDVSGQWNYTSDYSFSNGSVCHVTGLVNVDQDGPNVTLNIRNDLKPADNYRCEGDPEGAVDSMSLEGLLATGFVVGSRVTMKTDLLDYSGSIVGDPATQVSGSILIFGGKIGTWSLNR